MTSWIRQRQEYANQLEEFEYRCNASLVDLHPSILNAAYDCAAPDITYDSADRCMNYQPTPMYSAVVQAGRILVEQPGVHLAKRPITFALAAGDIAMQTLITMVNASQNPVSSLHNVETQAIPFSPNEFFHACEEAEAYFGATIALMNSPDEDLSKALGYWIIMDEDRPVGLRKGLAYPSMLSLQEIAINGIPYPAGSLMRAHLPSEKTDGGYEVVKNSSDQGIAQLRQLEQVSFVRLTAYALDPGKRAEIFPEAIGFAASQDHQGYDVCQAWNLNQIEAAVRAQL